MRGESVVNDIGKAVHHYLSRHLAQRRGDKRLAVAFYIAARDDGRYNRRVGAGAPDPLVFEEFYQRTFCKTRGRFGKMLIRLHSFGFGFIAFGQFWQFCLFTC